jgi:sugar lactone lactonase YvrE/uncharacterized protein (DUF2345 family)
MIVALCGVVVATLFPQSSPAQQINYSTFNTPQAAPSPFSNNCPAATNILFCANYVGAGPSFVQDFYPPSIDPNAATDGNAGSTNYALQLTQNAAGQGTSVWFATPQDVVDGFTTWYTVKINYQGGGDGNTADGLAFVIQNAAGGQTDPLSTCAETGMGPTALGASGGCLGYGGIDNSAALEMDTFFSSWDPQQGSRGTSYSDNHLALQGCGLDGNGNPLANSPTHTTNPNCLITLGNTSTLITNPVTSVAPPATSSAILLSDGNPHQVVMVYNGPNDSPANFLTVYLDATYNPGTHTPVAGSVPLFSGPFDLTKYMKLSSAGGTYSPAYVGFTAATGGDYEQHELMGWTFTPHANQPNFGGVNVCPSGQTTPAPCSETLNFTYKFPNGATLGTPQIVTQGVSGLDFTLNPSGTTCTGTVAPGSCTVSVIFAPLAPGLRQGAVNVVDTGGNLLASTLIYGTGQGPAVAFAQAPQGTLNTGTYVFNQPKGLTTDAAGNLYVADTGVHNDGNRNVVRIAPDGTRTTLGSGLLFPQGVAVDGAGDLFVADNDLNQVIKIPVGCTSNSCQQVLATPQCVVGQSGLCAQLGVAVDGPGNVFIASFNSEVLEVPASGGAQTVVYSPANSHPIGLAVDAAGDLFIADYGLARVVKVPAGCVSASCQTTVGSGWSQPDDVAVDAAGDIFVADAGLQQVVEVPTGCTAASCQIVVASGILTGALTVNAAGDVFADNLSNNTIVKISRSQPPSVSFAPANVGASSSPIPFTFQNIGNQPLNAESPGLITVNGLNFASVPGSGTPADCSLSSILLPGQPCNLSLSFEPQSAGPLSGSAVFTDNALNATSTTQTIALSGTGLVPSYSLTVTGLGNGLGTVTDNLGEINCSQSNEVTTGLCAGSYTGQVTLTATPQFATVFLGWGGVCASAGTNPTCTLTLAQAGTATASFVNPNFGNVNVCASGSTQQGCAATMPVTYNLPATTAIGATKVVTQGLTGLDFTLGSGNTCTGTVVAGNSCTVNVNFSPLAPGLRMGAVQIFDNAGNLLETTPIYGIGQGAAIAFSPSAQATVGSGLATPFGVTLDAAGDVFIGDYGNQRVVEIPASGGNQITIASGLNYPEGVAVDGVGNVYIADSDNNHVLEVPPGGGPGTTVGSGLSNPTGVAVDGAGNVFIADYHNNRVVKVPAGGGPQTTIGSGLNVPQAVAVDGLGNVFIADSGNNQVVKVTSGGVQTTVPASGLNDPIALAVDAAGDVFIGNYYNDNVIEVTPAGVQTIVPTSGLGGKVLGVSVDGGGNLFLSDFEKSRVVKVNRSQPPAISFATTNVGSTSADSPVAFTVQNVGNQPLTGSVAFNLGTSFRESSTNDCSNSLPLAPGGVCGESFSFTPQSATFFSGNAVFTDNSLTSAAPGTQTIPIFGIGANNGVAGTVAVPNVVGQTQTAATAPINAAGLGLGSVSTASSQTVPAGTIISENPVAGTQVAVGSAVNLLVSSGLPQQPSPNPLLLENNYFLTGDYVSAGVTLRGTGKNGIATGTITIPSATQSAQGIPDGADVVDAFLYWESVENTASASSTNGTFNGYSIVGQQIGSDIPNYTDGAVTGTLRSYRASVNIYLPVGANGIRIVSGPYTVSLPDSGGSTYPLTEGASLVLVYRVLSPNFPLKSVIIYDGAAQPTNSATQVVKGFYDAVGGANGTGKNTNLFASGGVWNNSVNTVTLGQSNQYSATLNAPGAYAAVILSTPVNNSDNDGILDAWKAGPAAGDFHAGQPGYYDVKTSTWVGLPGAKHGQKDLFVQMDYMCGAVLASGSCDPTQENLFPSPDASGNDPLVMVQQAFAQSGVVLHLQVGNAVPESTCTDDLTTTPATLCQFPNQPGVIGWKNSLEFSKLYPRNLASCLSGGDCTTRFPYGQKDSYHYVLFGHSLAIPAYNTRFGTLTSINVVNGVTTIVTADRGTGISACPSRITLEGVLGNPSLNGIYNTTSCADTKTITVATPGVPNWSYPNTTLPEPVIGLTSGTITSISGYSDLGGADSAVTLGLWLTAPNQDMSKKANVLAGTLFHEIGHTLGLSHGGLYYDTPSSYVPTFEANCKPNYQSIMNYLFQLDGVGPNQSIAFSNQTLNTLNETTAGSVSALTDLSNLAATFSTSAWYVPYTAGSPVTPATRHCDGTPLTGDSIYRVDAPISPITPPWTNGQDLNGIGTLQTKERGFNDLTNLDLRQVGATGGEFAALATQLSFGSSVAPLNISAGGNVTLGSGGTIALGSGGNVTLGSGGNVTLGSGGTITLGSGGNVTLGSGGNVTLGSGGTITLGSGGNVTLGSGGNVTLGSGGTITLGSGGNVTLGSGGNVTLGSGGTIALGSGGTVTIPSSGGSYTIDGNGGTITLGSGGNVTLGSGGNVTLGSGGTITLGSGGNVTLGSGGNVTLGSGGTITLGSGGNVTLGSGGNVTLGSGGTITLGSGGNVTLGSGGNVTLGSGGTVTLGSGGNVALGSGGNVTLGSGGTATLGAGGTITLGSGGNVTLGSGGNVTLGSGGTITLGSGGNVTLGSGGNVTLGSGGTITLGSGGNVTLGSGGTVTLGSGGTITLGSGGAPITIGAGGSYTFGSSGGTITLGSGGNVTLGSGGNVTLGSGGTIALGSGGNVTLGSGGNVTLGSGGNITLGSGGTITLGSGGNVTLGSGGVVTLGNGGSVNLGIGSSSTPLASVPSNTSGSGGPMTNELTYETANSVVRVPTLPVETVTPAGVRITWKAPAFGVVATYTIYRSSDGATPIVIGSVSGVNGNPPATEFTDTNPDLTAKTVVYTVTTTLVADTTGGAQRSSPLSAPAVLKNDQTITLGPLPSSVPLTSSPTVTATAMSSGVPNGLQVVFSSTGSCTIASQGLAANVSSATLALSGAGSCTVIASQPGSTTFNAANSVSGTFMVLPTGSSLQSQTINFATLPNAQYGSSFSLSATSSSGLPVTFTASGPCKTDGSISGVGVCSITASAAGNSTYSAASLTQSFTVYPAVLKVTATSLTSTYGQPLPALAYSYSGFVKNDTASVVNGAPGLSTTATSTSNAGSYPITVSTGTLATMNYSFLYVNGTLTIQPAAQAALVLHAASPLTFGQSETLSVTGGTTSGAVTYAVTGGPCGLSGAQLTAASGTGACTVTATMAGNANYAAVTSPTAIVVLMPVPQAIAFTTNPPATAAYNSTFTVAATGGMSGNPVIFTSAGACSNVGATYTMTNSTGTCSVIANQAGNSNYAPAAVVTKTVIASGPLLSLSTSSINFGTLYAGSISTQTVTVTNIGNAPVTINDPILSLVKGGNSNEFIALSLCPKPLAAGKSCYVTIAFLAGPFYTPQTATLQIMSNAPGSPQPVTLSAQVIYPVARFSPSSLNFGTIKHATSSTLNVTLTNPGGTPLILTGINVTGTNAAYFAQTNNCGSSLAAGSSCTVAVNFTPAATGSFSANLTFVDNAQSGGGTQTVALSGKGN